VLGRKGVVGSVFYIDQDYWPHDTTLYVKDFHGNNARYVYYFFQDIAKEIANLDVGSANPTLNRNHLHPYAVKWPNRNIQNCIVAILSSLDDKIALNRATNQTLEAIAQALFKSWFVDFDPVHAKVRGEKPLGMDEATAALFPDSFEESELGRIPKGWEVQELSAISGLQNGYAFKSEDWVEKGHSVIKIGDVKPGLIDTRGSSFVADETVFGLERYKLCTGDLLVGMTGYVGETGLVPKTDKAIYLNQRVGKFISLSSKMTFPFIYCVVRNPKYKIFAERKAKGSAQANISSSELLSYQIVLPPPALMNSFQRIVNPIINSMLSSFENSDKLSQLRDSLLPKLLSGEISVAGIAGSDWLL
jgi:type I restriction enzyme S subunit